MLSGKVVIVLSTIGLIIKMSPHKTSYYVEPYNHGKNKTQGEHELLIRIYWLFTKFTFYVIFRLP